MRSHLKLYLKYNRKKGRRSVRLAEENVPSQVARKAVSEDSRGEESQDTGGDSLPSSSDETNLEIRKAEKLTACLKNIRVPETKKETFQ